MPTTLTLILLTAFLFCGSALAQDSSSKRPLTSAEKAVWPKTFSSQQGIFTLTVQPLSKGASDKIIPLRELHRWKMRLTSSRGEPISGARILIDGGMPAHAHGLPSAPKIKAISSNGDYIINGMKFNMGGEWLLRFNIIHQQQDQANLTIHLDH